MNVKNFKTMRVLTLVLQLLSIFFSYTADLLHIGKSMGEITDQYDSLFRPASYTFAIWGLIYLAFLVYCIVQLMPSQANLLAYERLNKHVRLSAILNIAWQVCFRLDLIPASAIIILFMLLIAIILFARAHYSVNKRNFSLWITVPFSMYLAWLSVATVANISLWLRYRDVWWNGAGIEADTWVVIMLAIVLLITQSVSINFKDFVFPLVVCWASIGIWVTLKNNDYLTSKASLGAAIIAFVIAVVSAIKRKNKIGLQVNYRLKH